MSSIEIKILRHLKKNPSSRKDLKSSFKHKNVGSTIENLLRKDYIEPTIIGTDNIKITNKGQQYESELSKQRTDKFYSRINLVIDIIMLLLAALQILSQKSVSNANESNNKIVYNNYLPTTVKRDSSFFLKDSFLFNGLTDSIEKRSKCLNNVSSSRIIEISYSGDLVPTQENYFYYPGGNIVIKFNGRIVNNIDTLKIEKTNTIGNLEEELETELKTRLKRIVNNNKRLFIDEIASILNK